METMNSPEVGDLLHKRRRRKRRGNRKGLCVARCVRTGKTSKRARKGKRSLKSCRTRCGIRKSR